MSNKPPGADKDPRAPYNRKVEVVDCDACEGTGENEDYAFNSSKCPYCNGTGELTITY